MDYCEKEEIFNVIGYTLHVPRSTFYVTLSYPYRGGISKAWKDSIFAARSGKNVLSD